MIIFKEFVFCHWRLGGESRTKGLIYLTELNQRLVAIIGQSEFHTVRRWVSSHSRRTCWWHYCLIIIVI